MMSSGACTASATNTLTDSGTLCRRKLVSEANVILPGERLLDSAQPDKVYLQVAAVGLRRKNVLLSHSDSPMSFYSHVQPLQADGHQSDLQAGLLTISYKGQRCWQDAL
jgi:hypothetical protein